MSRKLICGISIVCAMCLAAGKANASPLQQDSGQDGIVSVEAEHFDDNVAQGGGQWKLVGPTGGFTGTAGMQVLGLGTKDTGYVTGSPRLDYVVNFAKTGTHYIWARAWGATGNDDTCHASLDMQTIATCDRMDGWNNNYRCHNPAQDSDRGQLQSCISGR